MLLAGAAVMLLAGAAVLLLLALALTPAGAGATATAAAAATATTTATATAVTSSTVLPSAASAAAACAAVDGIVLGMGNNLRKGTGTANSTADCCAQCRADARCKSWTMHPGNPKCYLHGTVQPRKHVAGAISGVPSGPVPPPGAPPPTPQRRQCTGAYQGCFKDFVPAPGVPPVRALSHRSAGPAANLSVASCAADCATLGFPLSGLVQGSGSLAGGTRAPASAAMRSCWCGCSLNRAATVLPNQTCAAPCGAQSGDGPCGGEGAMATFLVDCYPNTPPAPAVCGGNGSHVLPKGRACSQVEAKEWKFCDTSVPLDERVTDLVNRINMAEAGAMLTARQSPAIPRLGIPEFYWGTNAIHGIGNQLGLSVKATSFPQALNMGCTWNRTVMRGVGRTIGRELRALSNVGMVQGITAWSPTINLIRDPRWGRNQETVSEDPLLSGTYGAEFSLGMQYDMSSADRNPAPTTPSSAEFMAVATLKHVLGYSLEQWSPDGNWSEKVYTRLMFDSLLTPYDMEDSYTQPFKRAIETGGAAGVMYCTSSVNHVPAVANADIASRLRSWGFSGYRTTDGGGIGHLSGPQHYAANQSQGIMLALKHGESDIDDGPTYQRGILPAVEAGMNQSLVRRALFNTLRIRFRLGLFDPPEGQRWSQIGLKDVDTSAARQLNIEASRQSLVLLQNRAGALPFAPPPSGEVIVIGPSANSTRLLGGGHYARDLATVDGLETGGFPSIASAISRVLQEQRGTHEAGASARYLPGIKCSQRPDMVCVDPAADPTMLTEAANAASHAAQVVLVLNLQSRKPCNSDAATKAAGEFNPCGYEAEQHDRPSIELPKLQQELAGAVLNATKAAGVPTVVVLVHGGGLAIESIKINADAILDAHYPGEVTGGAAVADAIYGRFSPAGKLSYTVMPAAFEQLSNFASMSMTAPPGRTYKYYPTSAAVPPPLWPFGWGLTYTRFNLTLARSYPAPVVLSAADNSAINVNPLTVDLKLENVGLMDSDEVLQAYMVPPQRGGGVPTPARQLLDFERVHVVKGATAFVSFSITASQLQLVDSNGTRVSVTGLYQIQVTNGVDATVSVPVSLVG